MIIILAENRICHQDSIFRTLMTLPNERISPEVQTHFSEISKFADNTLAPQKIEIVEATENQLLLLLPLVGGLEVLQANETHFISVGEVAYFWQREGESIEIRNPYETDLVSYLLIQIKTATPQQKPLIRSFDLEASRNTLIDIGAFSQKCWIGLFDSRAESLLHLSNKKAFVFVLNGTVEAANCLLEPRTALAVWRVDRLDMEGLGNENMIFILEG